jgi:bisphosphoglycerate-independent phosphoglycerate mutase (AlkP superfamily)
MISQTEMSAFELTALIPCNQKKAKLDFVCLNFWVNGDMVVDILSNASCTCSVKQLIHV